MALSDSDKFKVIYELGWPGKTLVTNSTHYNRSVADRLTNLTTDIEDQVTSLLEKLDAVKLKYDASSSRMLVKKVGDIELNPDEHMLIGREYRRLKKELSRLLDIPDLAGSGTTIGLCV